jgi:heme-degrading monooxygenase HmoA
VKRPAVRCTRHAQSFAAPAGRRATRKQPELGETLARPWRCPARTATEPTTVNRRPPRRSRPARAVSRGFWSAGLSRRSVGRSARRRASVRVPDPPALKRERGCAVPCSPGPAVCARTSGQRATSPIGNRSSGVPRQHSRSARRCNSDGRDVRIWKANIDPARGDEYERFARERSLPMFRSHRGFRGCAFLRSGGDCVVVTLWDGPEDVAALEASHLYRTTVAAIMAAGFVRTAEEAIAVPVLL